LELVGVPDWTADEQNFARKLQEAADVTPEGLKTEIKPLLGPTEQRAPSNDCGDVSWKVPMGRVGFPSNVPNVPFHHWAGGAALATTIAHKGSVAGAKTLAGTVVDLLGDSTLVQRAKETFAEEIGEVVYEPLIPEGQKPPVDLNREMMEAFRKPMSAHYVTEKPSFD